MKKTLKNCVILLISMASLASCGSNQEASSATSTATSTVHTYTDKDHPYSNPDTEDESVISTITTDDPDFEFSTGTYGDFMIDIMFSRFLTEYSSYSCSYSPSTLDKTYRVVSSNTEVATVSEVENSSFTINTNKAGDTVLKIYGADDSLLLRKILRVRFKYKPEDILKKVLKYDIYKSWSYDGTLSFYIDNAEEKTGWFKGVESETLTVLKVNLSLEYDCYQAWADSYLFNVTTIKQDDESGLTISRVLISLTADQVIFYYDGGEDDYRLATMAPTSLTYLNPDLF